MPLRLMSVWIYDIHYGSCSHVLTNRMQVVLSSCISWYQQYCWALFIHTPSCNVNNLQSPTEVLSPFLRTTDSWMRINTQTPESDITDTDLFSSSRKVYYTMEGFEECGKARKCGRIGRCWTRVVGGATGLQLICTPPYIHYVLFLKLYTLQYYFHTFSKEGVLVMCNFKYQVLLPCTITAAFYCIMVVQYSN